MNKGILLPVVSLLLAVAVLLGLSFGLQGMAAQKAQSEHLRLMRTVLPDSENFTVFDGCNRVIITAPNNISNRNIAVIQDPALALVIECDFLAI